MVGRDPSLWDISTHTLTWSVTEIPLTAVAEWAISTHTLTWSVTTMTGFMTAKTKFQLTRSRGA